MKTANFLSLNGGGVRGSLVLDELIYLHEEKMSGKFFRHFDIIGGTSTGSLITALLATGKTPRQIKEIYERELPFIFKCGFLREIRGLSKYDNAYILGLANNLIGNTRLGDLKQKIVIPAVNSSKQETKIFKSYDDKDKDFRLVDVIIASSSAPRYFPAHCITVEEKMKYVKQWFKDGGLASNNPTDILALEALNPEYGFTTTNILSLTTGENKDVVTKSEKKGNLLSIPEMIDEILNLQDKKTHGTVSTLYGYNVLKGTYKRCEAVIENSDGSIDNVSKNNMENMKKDAALTLLKNKNILDEFYLKTKDHE